MFFIFYWRIFTARYLSFLLVAARLDMLSLAVTSYYYFYQVVTDHYFRQFIKHGINIEKIITSTHVYKFQVRSRFRFSNKLLYAYYKEFTRLDWGLNIPIQDLSPPWLIQIILLKKKLDLHKKIPLYISSSLTGIFGTANKVEFSHVKIFEFHYWQKLKFYRLLCIYRPGKWVKNSLCTVFSSSFKTLSQW